MFLHHRPVLESVNAFLQVPCDSVIQIEERLPWATYLPGRRIKLPLGTLFTEEKKLRGDIMRKEVHLEGAEYEIQNMTPCHVQWQPNV